MAKKISNGVKIPIEISARHVHLTLNDLKILFGENYKLTKFKDLSQPGQFAANETLKLIGPKGQLENVRILGPVREKTQVEISETDARELGIDPPVKESGNLADTPGIKLVGPKSMLNLKNGVILALRHLHVDPETAKSLSIKDGDRIKVDISGKRDLLFENVLVRANKNFKLAMHIDTDEANAAGIDANNHEGEIIV